MVTSLFQGLNHPTYFPMQHYYPFACVGCGCLMILKKKNPRPSSLMDFLLTDHCLSQLPPPLLLPPVCTCRHRGLRAHMEEVPRPLLPILQPETHVGGRREGLQGAQRPPGEHPQPGRAELHQRCVGEEDENRLGTDSVVFVNVFLLLLLFLSGFSELITLQEISN